MLTHRAFLPSIVLVSGAAVAAACGGDDGAVPNPSDVTSVDGGSSGASTSSGGTSSSGGSSSGGSSSGASSSGGSSGSIGDAGPEAGPPAVFATTLAAGGSSACVIGAGGVLKCWGAGKGVTEVVAPGTSWSEVDLGNFQTCAIKADKSLWCWQSATFTPATKDTGAFKKVSTGEGHACAINDAGKLFCWGANVYGGLGTGDTTNQSNLTAVASAKSWSTVSAGSYHTCAIDDGGALYCWGYNAGGQVGDGGGTSVDAGVAQQHLPVAIMAGTTWLDVSAGYFATCGVASDRRLRCWGTSQLTQNVKVPTAVDTATDWAMVRMGSTHSCALKTTGALYCWGTNSYGQLGNGSTSNVASLLTQVGGDTDWAAVDVGANFTCARKTNGGIYCWGTNGYGELGIGTADHTTPKKIGAAADWKTVDATENTTCAVKKTGELLCWGQTNYVAGPETSRKIPYQVGTANDWSTVSVGLMHACALKTNNAAYCWGYSSDGALGIGAVYNQATPTSVGLNATSISAGSEHTCAIQAGTSLLYCWGENVYDQQFTPSGDSNVPRQTAGTATWAKIVAGYRDSCGILSNGDVICAGLGYNETTNGGELMLTGATDISAPQNQETTRAISGGKIKSWSYSTTPIDDGAETSWKSVSAGYSHRCAIRNDNTLACAGTNTYGQIGDGTKDARGAYTNVGAAADWESVAVGRNHTCGIRNAGELYCWGDNAIGQIGDGSAWHASPMPVQ